MSVEPVLSDSDKASVIKRYARRFDTHGASLDALNVGNIAKYMRQHEIHYELMPAATQSVTDIGCGIAAFYDFLKEKGSQVAYTGLDIVPAFIQSNKARHPEATFELRDVFAEGLPGTTDHVVMCQVFNNRFHDSDNLAVITRAISIAFADARLSVSLDMLSAHVNYEEPHLYYYDPRTLLAYAKTLTPYVTLRHDYAAHHFTIGLYKTCTTGCA